MNGGKDGLWIRKVKYGVVKIYVKLKYNHAIVFYVLLDNSYFENS